MFFGFWNWQHTIGVTARHRTIHYISTHVRYFLMRYNTSQNNILYFQYIIFSHMFNPSSAVKHKCRFVSVVFVRNVWTVWVNYHTQESLSFDIRHHNHDPTILPLYRAFHISLLPKKIKRPPTHQHLHWSNIPILIFYNSAHLVM